RANPAEVGSTAGSAAGGSAIEHAEIVALRGGPHNPRRFALSDVNPRRTEPDQPLDLPGTVVGREVEVQSVLDRLRFRNPNEQQAWKPIRRRSNLKLLRIVIDTDPPHGGRAPPPECTGGVGGDSRLLPAKRHDWRVCHPSNAGSATAPQPATSLRRTTSLARRGPPGLRRRPW